MSSTIFSSLRESIPPNYGLPVASLAIFLLASSFALYLRAFPRPLPGIPYDTQAVNSLYGDVTSLRSDPEGLAKWCSKHLRKLGSPVAQVMMGPFTRPIVVVADIGETRDIMMKSDFDRSSYIIDRFPLFGGSQILMHTNDGWRTSRGWLKDLLTPQYLQNVAGPHIHSSVQQLIQLWELSSWTAGPNTPFNMQLDLKDLALDVMTQFHHEEDQQDLTLKRQIQHIQQFDGDFSKLVTGPSNKVTFPRAPLNTFHRAVMEIADRMATIYTSASAPWLISWWTQHIMPHYRKLFAAKQTYIHERIDAALERLYQGEKPKTGIEHMVYGEHKAAEKAGRRPRYKDQIMVDEIFGNHIAGLHTTSSAMVWILKYLTENPDVQAKLWNELQNAFPAAVEERNRLPTTAEFMSAKLPYLDAVIEGTLRLRAALLIARNAVRDTELLGFKIPEGTVCLLICQGVEQLVHQTPKSEKPERQYPGNGSPDLEVFDPGRWLVRKNQEIRFDGASNSHLAFGLGMRGCWGRKLAELEMKMTTAMLTWSFEMLSVSEELSGHDGVYDFSFRANRGFLQLRKHERTVFGT